MRSEELFYHVLIFLRFQAASAVNQQSARFYDGCGVGEQGKLRFAQAFDFLGPQSPAQIHAPPDDAGIGAGRIHEHAVEGGKRHRVECIAGGRGCRFHGCRWTAEIHTGHAEPPTVILDKPKTCLRNIAGDNAALVVEQLGDEGGFAAWSSAVIENRFSGLRSEELNGEQRARVLDVKPAVPETAHARQRRMRLQLENQVLRQPVAVDEVVFDVFHLPPAFEQFTGIGFESINPGKSFRWGVVPFEQPDGVFHAPELTPASDQPLGMRPAKVRLRRLEIRQ